MIALAALALTIAIELPLALWLVRESRPKSFLLDVMLVNLMTNPAANAAFDLGAPFWGIEAAVVVVEFAAYCLVSGLSARRSALVASVTNLVSASLGLALS